jgi:uncharacterized membrane protein
VGGWAHLSVPSHIILKQLFVGLLWQVLFAFIPPTDYCGGWATFFVSLVFIGGVTAVVAAFARACFRSFVRQASRCMPLR